MTGEKFRGGEGREARPRKRLGYYYYEFRDKGHEGVSLFGQISRNEISLSVGTLMEERRLVFDLNILSSLEKKREEFLYLDTARQR